MPSRKTFWIQYLAVVVVMTVAVAAAAGKAWAVADASFQSAVQSFLQASSGDKAAIDPAADAFDALLKAEPTNPVLMVYAGASTALKARSSGLAAAPASRKLSM